MKSLKKYTIFIIVCLILIGSTISNIVGMENQNKEITLINTPLNNNTTSYNNQHDGELPIWNIGDKWIYKIEIDGQSSGDLGSTSSNIKINQLNLEVIDIKEDFYKLKLNVPKGSLTGYMNIDWTLFSIQGSLNNGKITGSIKINKSDISLIDAAIDFDGFIDNIAFNGHIWSTFAEVFDDNNWTRYNYSPIKFPFNIGDVWKDNKQNIEFGLSIEEMKIGIFDLVKLNKLTGWRFNLRNPTFKCTKWATLNLNNKEIDALEITRNSDIMNRFWYSPSVGNIVKTSYNMIDLDYGVYLERLDMELISTTFTPNSNPPEQPATPTGSNQFIAGESGNYETVSNDPDGDIVKYIFNWGDGTTSSSDFTSSGESVLISKIWTKKGIFDVKVKARDKYGMESSWSDSLQVIVENTAPDKPNKPVGPNEGKIRQSYHFKTSSNDSDKHKIRYGWDWNGDEVVDEWTDFSESGKEIITSHIWNDQGTYNIKVKAQDEFGEESTWSDSLEITMPKTKENNRLFNRLLEEQSYLFQILRLIFHL